MTERTAIRLGIPTLLLTSTAGALAVSLQTAAAQIPAFAFGSPVVLAVQLTLLFFYAALLLLVPLIRAVSEGELPIELSLKGARWKESVDGLGRELAERLEAVEKKALDETFEMHREIEALKQSVREVANYDVDDGSG